MSMGWSMPQVVTAYFARALPYRKPLYIYGNAARMALIAAFVGGFFIWRDSPRTVGMLYFVLLGLAGLAAGAVGLAYQDIVARTIPADRRGAYTAYRILGGQGVLALASGFIVKYILDHPERYPYPGNYIMIFALSWALMATAVVAFSFVKEPADKTPRRLPRPGAYMLEMWLIVKNNRNYRLYLVQKLLRSCENFAIPYYVIYAGRRLGLGAGAVGTFLVVGVITTAIVPLWWGRLADRKGNRAALFWSSVVAAAAPFAALAAAVIAGGKAFAGEQVSLQFLGWAGTIERGTAVTVLLAPIFVLLSAAGAGFQIGGANYIMDTAPARRRPVYLGITTTIDGLLLVISPAIGGFVIDATDYWVAFLAAGVGAAASAAVARRLWEPRGTGG
jgi:MFS family permease